VNKDIRAISEIEKEVALLLSSNLRLTLKEIGRFIGIDRHKIQHAVREHHGCSFRVLKQRIKFARAHELLIEKPHKYFVKEVAAEIGVTANALSRFFKTMTGHSPTKLRCLK
jgi:YesN/AraC family two-component response regulator